jgi:hypothetical protein
MRTTLSGEWISNTTEECKAWNPSQEVGSKRKKVLTALLIKVPVQQITKKKKNTRK